MHEKSALETAVDNLLQATKDIDLDTFLADRRPGRSYEKIARDIEDTVGVRLSWQTVRGWVNKRVAA